MPKVTWYKDGEILRQMERISVIQDDSCTVLTITDCQRPDSGKYGVRIENYLGIDEAAFAVNVTGRPTSIYNVRPMNTFWSEESLDVVYR